MRTLFDLDAADRDTRPPRDPAPPTRSYVICSTPRSGSNLLCRGLAMTGGMGTPLEYFNPARRQRLAERWQCGMSLEEYIRALWTRRTTHNGVFGLKLHWEQFVPFRAEALGVPDAEPGYAVDSKFLERFFPECIYFRIVRLDVNRQAVSLWFAIQTETWALATHDAAGLEQRASVEYSFNGIERCRQLIENGEVHWDRFFRFNQIEPRVIVYEEFVVDYARTLATLGQHVLGAADVVQSAPPRPDTRLLADDRSNEFVERFAADLHARGWQDPRTPRRPST
jgi:LPS sulfotransferase NodH